MARSFENIPKIASMMLKPMHRPPGFAGSSRPFLNDVIYHTLKRSDKAFLRPNRREKRPCVSGLPSAIVGAVGPIRAGRERTTHVEDDAGKPPVHPEKRDRRGNLGIYRDDVRHLGHARSR